MTELKRDGKLDKRIITVEKRMNRNGPRGRLVSKIPLHDVNIEMTEAVRPDANNFITKIIHFQFLYVN